MDGSGAPWFRADVAVRGDTIAAVAPRLAGAARRVIEAGGRVAAPGFIDLHSHARGGIFERPAAENYVRQGVTTLVEGPDGSSPLPLGAFLDKLEELRPGVNLASFVGHGSVRAAVVGTEDRSPTPAELERMRELVRQAMRDGAFGLSTGLFYVPGSFARTDEVIALARVAGELGGMHISHMRDEAAGVLDSVRETIAIGEEGGLPTQVTHHKMIGTRRLGAERRVAAPGARGARARRRRHGRPVPLHGLEHRAQRGALARVVARRRAGAPCASGSPTRPSARASSRSSRTGSATSGAEAIPRNIQIAACGFDHSLEGRTLAAILEGRGVPSTVESAAELTLEIAEQGGASAIFHAISEEDVERILAAPFTMIASDGEIPAFGQGAPHPRSYGTFARVLAVYVREKRLLTLEDAIRKMTSLPAARLGLADRGLLAARHEGRPRRAGPGNRARPRHATRSRTSTPRACRSCS